MRINILILFYVLSITVSAQTIITGTVTDKQLKGVSDVSITLLSIKDSSIVAYSMSDEKGFYKITYTGKEPELLISANSFGIKRQSKKITNKTQSVDFIVEEGGVELKEVIVNSKKIYGVKDTINYSVSAFKDAKDVVIGDVLKKMPGIAVSEDGQISYQGKPINKFYIEGMDLLGGRYGIATNNVSAEDVATVQVLENHQPIKALETTTISTDAAINLKIKEDKKGIFTSRATTELGYGDKLLWHGELNGMYFGKGFQHISTYKADNAGSNIARELNSFYSQGGLSGMLMTGMQQPSAPGINNERYYFNDSHAVTLNNLKKLKNDAELNFNLIFSNDRNRRHGFTRTDYVLPGDSIVTISEDISTWNRTNRVETEFRYNRNKQNIYFSNYLNVSAGWNDGTGEIITDNPIGNRFENRIFKASNATHWIKTKEEGRGFEFLSVNSAISQPHSLIITPGLYPEIFNDKLPYQSLTQQVRVNGFASNNRFSKLTALMLGDVRINPAVSVNVERRTFVTEFELMQPNKEITAVTDAEMRNNLGWTHFNSAFDLGASYNGETFKFNLSLPIGYNHTLINNAFRSQPYKRDKVYFQPSASAIYSFSENWEFSTRYGFGINSPGAVNALHRLHLVRLPQFESLRYEHIRHLQPRWHTRHFV
ncbi:MAG: hypothetical protein QM751_03900 [Paludibacteraceae bacterium]